MYIFALDFKNFFNSSCAGSANERIKYIRNSRLNTHSLLTLKIKIFKTNVFPCELVRIVKILSSEKV